MSTYILKNQLIPATPPSIQGMTVASAAPTMVEFNALVASYNSLLDLLASHSMINKV